MEQLRKQGYSVARTAGSHGPFDVIAISKEHIKLIQLKRCLTKKGPSAYNDDIDKLKEVPVPETQSWIIIKELWIWIDRKGWDKVLIE